MARKALTKKTRFEVFKRDSFTCQYCGRMAPDVILEVDHINPVANGGDNSMINLVTSCFDCNRGKSDRTLADGSAVVIEKKQMDEINSRREQMKLMVQWKKELRNLSREQFDIINDEFRERTGRFIKKPEDIMADIQKYGFSEVLESTYISLDQYYTGSEESAIKAYTYIRRICAMRRRNQDDPYLKDKLYIRKILKNKQFYISEPVLTKIFALVDNEHDSQMIKDIAKDSRNWSDFINQIDRIYGMEGD